MWNICSCELSIGLPSTFKGEFIAKIGIVVEESDEAVLWLELLVESGIVSSEKAGSLLKEARELTAIFTASQRTARGAA